jgi:SM-20-related protein
MLNIEALERSSLSRDPYDFVIVDDFVPGGAIVPLSKDFPNVPTTGSYPLSELSYGPIFAQLIDELNGPDFQRAMAKVFDIDLSKYVRVITIRGRVGSHDGSVHTDAKWKIVSVLLYLNPQWNDQGGRLRLLRDNDVKHVAVEVEPKWGTLLAFRRADNSWHGHLPAEGERRVVQINWVTSREMADKELRRHRRSAWLKRLFKRSA